MPPGAIRELQTMTLCTLCSCYPLALLGPSSSWYKSEAHRSRVVRDPRGVLAEFDYHVPADVTINVCDPNTDARYLVIPKRPPNTEHLDREALANLVSRRGLVGTAPL
jgi:nitrile hydratase